MPKPVLPINENLSDYSSKRVVLLPIRSEGETLDMFNASNDLKKAFNVRLSSGENYPLRRDMVYCFFDIPAVEAARIMCVSLSLLKKIRAWVKLDRWPCSQIHCADGECFGLTRTQVIQGRDEVILSLEREYLDYPLERIKLAIKIVKDAREYAKVYACLVNPDAGRVQTPIMSPMQTMQTMQTLQSKVAKGGDSPLISRTYANDPYSRMQELFDGEGNDKLANEIMESMQPRQVVKRKSRLPVQVSLMVSTKPESLMATTEPESLTTDCFWPIPITQEFNFDQLFDTDGLEDELDLGPLKLSASENISTSAAN
jgi:hypothetical protein